MEGEACDPAAAVDSSNPLLKAVFLRRLRLTRLLLEGGAYINESDGQGRTPLMVACRTRYADAQSVSRAKLVQFLLEKGADPDIQDKEGRSALMHACRERAGPEVAALLLESGADVSLEDRSGTSALVHAVVAGDWTVLKLLLDTCKARGKEVIIITADGVHSGGLQVRQHLGLPHLRPTGPAAAAPASPSEVQIITSPHRSSADPPNPVFSFKEAQAGRGSSHPGSPSRTRAAGQGQQQPLLRLNSEPWLKVSTAPGPRPPSEDRLAKRPAFRVSNLDPDSLSRAEAHLREDEEADADGSRPKITLPGLSSSHSASHPNLTCSAPAAVHGLGSSSLNNIIQRCKVGADIYGSDPQLAAQLRKPPEDPRPRDPAESKRLVPLRCSSTLGSGEPSAVPGPNRRLLSGYERRGSGAFLLDRSPQTRPRSLPPLAFGGPLQGPGGDKDPGLKPFLPVAPPGQPTETSKRLLLRRHSMQTERIKTAT